MKNSERAPDAYGIEQRIRFNEEVIASISVEGQEVNYFPWIKKFDPLDINYNGLHIEVLRVRFEVL
jgi:hypothetical protein